MKNVFIIFFSIIVGISAVFSYSKAFPAKKIQLQKMPAVTSHFSMDKAPSKSLVAEIATFSGKVAWQSRVATEASTLKTPRPLQQGENVITTDTGNMSVAFPNVGTITLLPNTKIEIIQTLPIYIVLSQDTGIATYNKTGMLPFAIHTLDLLVQQRNGAMTISVDDVEKNVRVKVTSGSAATAFEDSDNNTQITSVTSGQTVIFDDQIKEVVVQ